VVDLQIAILKPFSFLPSKITMNNLVGRLQSSKLKFYVLGLTCDTDQEYDAQANMLDDHETDNTAFTTATFQTPALPQQMQHGMPPPSPANPNVSQSIPQHSGSHMTGLPNTFDPSDPILDADPFGLSASMYFPTPYSFDAHR
jgi:hypothetical protein